VEDHVTINWGALGIVAAASLVIAVLVVVLVSVALVGLSAREAGRVGEPPDGTLVLGDPTGPPRAAGTVLAAICLVGAVAIVLYGLYILTF
jgi:hypothetical protein